MLRSEFDTLPTNEDRYVSTAQVAKALGIGVTTVKRWVDDDILPAHRTAGGHRKLLLSDVLRLAREEKLPQADIASLIPRPPLCELEEPRAIYEQLVRAIADLDLPLIRATIHGAYQNGYPIETLADHVVAPAMAEVGHDWEIGRIDVSHEHRVTQAIVSALYELGSFLYEQPLSERPLALGGAPEHDHYILPSLMCKLVLMDAGWEVVHLGAHTPFSAFIATMERLRPRLIWLSVTYLQDTDRFLSDYRDVYRFAEQHGIAVAIGGRALTESIRRQMPYTTFGDGLTQLASFARSLYKLPRRPRRGRPVRELRTEAATDSPS